MPPASSSTAKRTSWWRVVQPQVDPLRYRRFYAMKALSTRNDEPEKASRPFDMDRNGFVMGEGARIMVLESEERAKARGAEILGVVAGIGNACDAFHITAPVPMVPAWPRP